MRLISKRGKEATLITSRITGGMKRKICRTEKEDTPGIWSSSFRPKKSKEDWLWIRFTPRATCMAGTNVDSILKTQ
jgi:hypothetical protein